MTMKVSTDAAYKISVRGLANFFCLLPVLLWPFATHADSTDYEIPGTMQADKTAPLQLPESDSFTISPNVHNDGLINTYSVSSQYGEFSVSTTYGVCKLAREINAIGQIEHLKGTGAITDSAIDAAKGLGTGAWALVTNPVESLGGAAKGIGKAFRRLGNRVVEGDESSQYEDSSTQSVIGFSKVKRQYAYDLGIDVYSANEQLQTNLDELTWQGFSGGAVFTVATMAVGGLAGAALTVSDYTQTLNETLRDTSPTDLREQNRNLLLNMGVNRDLTDLFIKTSTLSPRHQTFIVGALNTMKDTNGQKHFIRSTVNVESDDEALYRQAQAEMYADYHANVQPVERFIAVNEFVVAVAADDTVIAAVPADHMIWTEQVSGALRGINILLDEIGGSSSRQLRLTGTASSRLKRELSDAGWGVEEHVMDHKFASRCDPDVPEIGLGEDDASE